MSEAPNNTPNKTNLFYKFDSFVKRFIPNFNVRAVVYFSLIFAIAMYLQVLRISSDTPPQTGGTNETVIADNKYWESKEYSDKIHNQTIESFTNEFSQWLNDKNQEFPRRKFEDMFYINSGLTSLTGGDLAVVVPENFNYLENHARGRYQYAKEHSFLSDSPTLIKHGTILCDMDEKTEKDTGIELYEWRYTDMPKLAEFLKTSPDWKIKVGDKIFEVNDARIEDKDLLKLKNSQNQPVGLFSFLVFRIPDTNRIFLADSTILEQNGIDDALTTSRIGSHWDKQPKLYFKYGYEGCKQINSLPKIEYGQSH